MNGVASDFGIFAVWRAAAAALLAFTAALHADETRLPIVGTLGVGPVMDVAIDGDRAFVIGRGKLHVVDVHEPGKPRVLGSLSGLGNTRQIAVAEGVAYVSARESGLFIVDVRQAQPSLISHYDSIELATGVAIAGKVLFIAQRLVKWGRDGRPLWSVGRHSPDNDHETGSTAMARGRAHARMRRVGRRIR